MKISQFRQNLITEVRRLIKEQAEKISRAELIDKIKATKGDFFTVTFVKRTDGSIRTINARLGVKRYLRGGSLPYDAAEKDVLPVYDVKANGYRMIDLRTISSAKIGGQEYIVG